MDTCESCGKQVKEVFECERCLLLICEDCQADFNQFSQIDYNCCKDCAAERY